MLSSAYRQRAARAVFGSARSELIPAVLWLGWLNDAGEEVTSDRVRVDNTDAVFGPSGDGVTNIKPIDAGTAQSTALVIELAFYDAPTGGTLIITAPTPATEVGMDDTLTIPVAGLTLAIA